MEKSEIDLTLRVSKLFFEFYDETAKQKCHWDNKFDLPAVKMFSMILGSSYLNQAETKEFSCKISRTEFSRKLRNQLKSNAINRRLELLARYFWIHIDSTARKFSQTGQLLRDTQTITPNEAFNVIFEVYPK